MKINSNTPLTQAQTADQTKAGQRAQGNAVTKPEGSPSAIAHISQAASDSSKDVNAVKVNELQTAIREGRLEIDPEKIADSLIASVQEMLSKDKE